MTALFSMKQAEFENLAEVLEATTLNVEIRPKGMSYVVTKYQEVYHEQAPKQCQCLKGFSIVQATINMRAWNLEGAKIWSVLIKPEILFSYGLLRKFSFS